MSSSHDSPAGPSQTDIFFVPAPERVVTEMLNIAQIDSTDFVMDLGSGAGGILIAAAKNRGSRGLGIEIDPQLIEESRARAVAAGVADRVEFSEQNFFGADLRPATVLMLYLLDTINIRLRPKILAECLPGTRVVTYSFEMGEWACDAHSPIAANGVSLWIVPANLTGTWLMEGSRREVPVTSLALQQRFQELTGLATVDGGICAVTAGRVRGAEFSISIAHPSGTIVVSGEAKGGHMQATLIVPDGTQISAVGEREVGTGVPLERIPSAKG